MAELQDDTAYSIDEIAETLGMSCPDVDEWVTSSGLERTAEGLVPGAGMNRLLALEVWKAHESEMRSKIIECAWEWYGVTLEPDFDPAADLSASIREDLEDEDRGTIRRAAIAHFLMKA